jgi:hypothetical protein
MMRDVLPKKCSGFAEDLHYIFEQSSECRLAATRRWKKPKSD